MSRSRASAGEVAFAIYAPGMRLRAVEVFLPQSRAGLSEF